MILLAPPRYSCCSLFHCEDQKQHKYFIYLVKPNKARVDNTLQQQQRKTKKYKGIFSQETKMQEAKSTELFFSRVCFETKNRNVFNNLPLCHKLRQRESQRQKSYEP